MITSYYIGTDLIVEISGHFLPLEPNPPSPRAVSESSSVSTISGVSTGAITI